MNLLLVEDDASLALALQDILELNQFDVHRASCGTSAITQLTHDYDLILTDINLGHGPDGFEVLRHAAQHCPGTPVIMMTAYTDVRAAVRAVQSGARDYLAKPFKPDELIAVLNKQLKGPKTTQLRSQRQPSRHCDWQRKSRRPRPAC